MDRALEIAPDNEFAVATMRRARGEVVSRYVSVEGAATEAPPEDAEILYVLGQLSRERGDLPGAEEFWHRAIEVEPNHGASLSDLGVLSLTRADTARALHYLGEAVGLKPKLASAWFNLGAIHLAQGRRPEATLALGRFIESAGPRYSDQVAWARQVLLDLERR